MSLNDASMQIAVCAVVMSIAILKFIAIFKRILKIFKKISKNINYFLIIIISVCKC